MENTQEAGSLGTRNHLLKSLFKRPLEWMFHRGWEFGPARKSVETENTNSSGELVACVNGRWSQSSYLVSKGVLFGFGMVIMQ